MEDGEKKYIRAPRDGDSMKRPWMGPCALKKVLGSNSMTCHFGFFFLLCFRIFMYKRGFFEGSDNNNEDPITLKVD